MLLVVLVLLFLVLPIAELAVIIQVADSIGIPETIVLLLAISVAGAWLCKREGVGVLQRIQANVARAELPARDLADGGLILLAGALLLTPGFLTDVLGLLLLLPPSRAVFRIALLRVLARRARLTVYTGPGSGPHGGPPQGGATTNRGGVGVIDTTESADP
jgi:UPF0716 protein FxsA